MSEDQAKRDALKKIRTAAKRARLGRKDDPTASALLSLLCHDSAEEETEEEEESEG